MILLTLTELYFVLLFPLVVIGLLLFLWFLRIYRPLKGARFSLKIKDFAVALPNLLSGNERHFVKSGALLILISLFWVVILRSQEVSLKWVDFYFLALLLSLMIFDAKYYLLPDPLVFSLLWGGILLSLLGLSSLTLSAAIWGVIYAYGVMLLVYLLGLWRYKREVLGRGDLKFSAAIGAWVGGNNIAEFLFLGAILGLCYGFLEGFKFSLKTEKGIPFGPSLGFSGIILYFITRLTASF